MRSVTEVGECLRISLPTIYYITIPTESRCLRMSIALSLLHECPFWMIVQCGTYNWPHVNPVYTVGEATAQLFLKLHFAKILVHLTCNCNYFSISEPVNIMWSKACNTTTIHVYVTVVIEESLSVSLLLLLRSFI